MKKFLLLSIASLTMVTASMATPTQAEYNDQAFVDAWSNAGANPTILWFDMGIARRKSLWRDDNLLSSETYKYSFSKAWDEMTGPTNSVWFGSPTPDNDTIFSMWDCHEYVFYAYHYSIESDGVVFEMWHDSSNGHYSQSKREGFWRGVGYTHPYGTNTSNEDGAIGEVGFYYISWAIGEQYTGSGTAGWETAPITWGPTSQWSFELSPNAGGGNQRILGWTHD